MFIIIININININNYLIFSFPPRNHNYWKLQEWKTIRGQNLKLKIQKLKKLKYLSIEYEKKKKNSSNHKSPIIAKSLTHLPDFHRRPSPIKIIQGPNPKITGRSMDRSLSSDTESLCDGRRKARDNSSQVYVVVKIGGPG